MENELNVNSVNQNTGSFTGSSTGSFAASEETKLPDSEKVLESEQKLNATDIKTATLIDRKPDKFVLGPIFDAFGGYDKFADTVCEKICEIFNKDPILTEAGFSFKVVHGLWNYTISLETLKHGYPIEGTILCDVNFYTNVSFDPTIEINLRRDDIDYLDWGPPVYTGETLGYEHSSKACRGVLETLKELQRIASMHDIEKEKKILDEKSLHEKRKCCVFGLCTYGTPAYEMIRKNLDAKG